MVAIRLTAILLLSLSSFLLAVPCGLGSEREVDPQYEAIRRLQPRLKPGKALRLARAIERVASACGMPWQILTSIAFHESSLGLNTENTRTNDYGLMQVNKKNLLRDGLSLTKIRQDAAYSLEFACKLLKENRDRYGEKYPYWLGIYRSGTALWREDIRANARRYDRMVRRTARLIGYHGPAVASR